MVERAVERSASIQLDNPQDVIAPQRELFRVESLKEQQNLWLGRQTLALGLPATVSSIASMIMVVAAAVLITYGSYARRLELHGLMLPTSGLVQITSPTAGWVQSLHTQDGEVVSNGTRLYSINTDIATQGGNTQQKILESLAAERSILLLQINRKGQIRDRQDHKLRLKIENLASQITQMNIQISVKEEFAKQTDKDLADFIGFVARGIGTLNEKVIRQQNWMRSKDDLEELKSRALRLQGDMLETQAQLSTLHLEKDSEIDGMRAKLSDLDKQVASSEARHSIEIVAPASGRSHRDFQSAGTDSYSWRTTADDCSVAGTGCRRSFWRRAHRSASCGQASGCDYAIARSPIRNSASTGERSSRFRTPPCRKTSLRRLSPICRPPTSPRPSIV